MVKGLRIGTSQKTSVYENLIGSQFKPFNIIYPHDLYVRNCFWFKKRLIVKAEPFLNMHRKIIQINRVKHFRIINRLIFWGIRFLIVIAHSII